MYFEMVVAVMPVFYMVRILDLICSSECVSGVSSSICFFHLEVTGSHWNSK